MKTAQDEILESLDAIRDEATARDIPDSERQQFIAAMHKPVMDAVVQKLYEDVDALHEKHGNAGLLLTVGLMVHRVDKAIKQRMGSGTCETSEHLIEHWREALPGAEAAFRRVQMALTMLEDHERHCGAGKS